MPANAILRYREYQQVTAAVVPASSTDSGSYVAHIHAVKLNTVTAHHLSHHTRVIFGYHAVRLCSLFVRLLTDSGNAANYF